MGTTDPTSYRYWAFISYSSKDKSWARWLHRAIETYGIPARLVRHPTPAGEPAPRRFRPLFHDRAELPASADLGVQIEDALRASRYLIVICSPHAARSKWVNKEVETFQRLDRPGCVLAVIVDGEPNAGDERECFPPALRQAEPIAADVRPEGDGKGNAKLKLLAGMLGVGFDGLKQRDTHRRIRRLQFAIGLALVLATGFGGLARYAKQQSRVALSGALAAQASSLLDNRLDVALLLAVEACRIAPTVEARSDLLKAMNHQPELSSFLWGHRGAISKVAFSPDGKTIASGGDDGEVIFWDAAARKIIGEPMAVHGDWVTGISFSPDGRTMASASRDTVILWDTKAHRPIRGLASGSRPNVSCLSFSPDGRILALGDYCGAVTLMDVKTSKSIGPPLIRHEGWFRGTGFDQKEWVNCVTFSPNGKLLACGGNDSTVVLWDVSTGRRIGGPLYGHRGKVFSIAFSPNGKFLASGHGYKTVILWDARTLNRIGDPLSVPNYKVTSLAFSKDGSTLAAGSGDTTITLWDLRTNVSAGRILTAHPGLAGSVAFGPDGKTLASAGSYSAVVLWNLENRNAIGEPLARQDREASCVAFSPNGKILASACRDTIVLWDVENRRKIGKPLTGHKRYVRSLSFSADGKVLFSISSDRKVSLLDLKNVGRLGLPPLPMSDYPRVLADSTDWLWFNPEQKGPAPASQDTAILWNVESLKPIGGLPVGRGSLVSSVSFSPDGRILASGHYDGALILQDVKTHKAIGGSLAGHSGWVNCLSFSRDGKILASVCKDTVILWDVKTHEPIGEPLAGHSGWVTSVSFRPDGKTLASASRDTLILWNVKTHKAIGTLLASGSPHYVTGLSFSPDGSTLASGQDNGIMILWDVRTQKVIGEPLDGPRSWVTSVSFSSDGKSLVSSCLDGTIMLWDVDIVSWENRACRIANRNLTREECEQYVGKELSRDARGNLPKRVESTRK